MSSLCCTIIVYIQVHQPGNESYVIHKLFFLKQVITTRLERKPFSAVHFWRRAKAAHWDYYYTARGRKQNRLPEEKNIFEYGAPLGSFSDLEYLLRYSNKPTHFIFIFF
jgi:hypothetical protein